MDGSLNIVIAGVGGQGTLVAGKLFGTLALMTDLDVKVSEVHGMSQRGGSVITYVRMGEKIYSPVIEKGGADFILAFEELEALRYAYFLSGKGTLIINKKQIIPVTVKINKGVYPENITGMIEDAKSENVRVIPVDADGLASMAGNTRAANMVMIGVMSRYTEIEGSLWLNAIDKVFPEKLREINRNAFHAGRNI